MAKLGDIVVRVTDLSGADVYRLLYRELQKKAKGNPQFRPIASQFPAPEPERGDL